MGSLEFRFWIKTHFLSAFMRQVNEAVAMKMGIWDKEFGMTNEKMEYNRYLIPDLLQLETPEESDKLQKLDEESIKVGKNTKLMWERWKAMGGGLPS